MAEQSNNATGRPDSPNGPQPDDDEDTITMLDVLEDEEKLQEEASAVLGNSDGKNCTYSKGYIPRQALYSCATCSEGKDEMAAICLACSLECHDNHQLYELYTKRNFRCDCGNSKFKNGFECKLDKQKLPTNQNNRYNHNFSGRYCVCDTAYPPEDGDDQATQDDMWQCVACEDWFHTKHLNAENLPDKFEELICGQCADRLDFVRHYTDATTTTTTTTETTTATSADRKDGATDASDATQSEDKLSTVDSNKQSPSTPSSDDVPCKLPASKLTTKANQSRPIFWPSSSWRKELCRCEKCMDLYKEKDCAFLLDETDTVQYYEAQGKANNSIKSQYEQGMSALGQMNRVAVVEALHSYNSLKADLSDYLRKFADNKKIVREEDIHEFFEQMKQKKRQKIEMTEFCR